MKRALGTIALSLVLSTSDPSRAQDTAAAAEALFREGKELLQNKQVDPACAKLEQSQALDPTVSTLGLLAFCHEQQGKTATAWQEYLKAAAMARDAKQSEREKVAREKAAELELRLPMLKIVVEQDIPGLEVIRAGRLVPAAELGVAVAVDPGRVEVRARAPGRKDLVKSVEAPNRKAELVVTIPPLEPADAPPAAQPLARIDDSPPASPSPASETGWRARDTLTVVAFAVGAAGIGVGTFFGLRARQKYDDSEPGCPDNRCTADALDTRNDAFRAANVSTAAFAIGALGVTGGIVLLVTGGGDAKQTGVLLPRVTPVFAGKSAAVDARWQLIW